VTPNLIKACRTASGFIFDMDGTIALGDSASGGHKALPFALETLDLLRRHKIPFRVFTNGTAKPPAAYASSLRRAGFDIRDEEMMTPSSSAATWFVKRGIRKVRVLGCEGVAAPLRAAGIICVGPSEKADAVEAVYTGWFREFTFPDLEAACDSIWAGAILTTASNVPFFATATGRGIGSSFATNAMLTAMTKKRARVLGKPSRVAFDSAIKAMGLSKSDAKKAIIVGDDPALEMRMANDAGVMGIGLTTGLMTRESLPSMPAQNRPTILLDSLELLARALA
jgi:4-nitrophenyl phosphatase